MNTKKIIGITGMAGSGKDAVQDIAREFNFGLVVMGDEVRVEVKRRNLNPDPENLGKVMLQMRAEEGPEVLARRCMKKIETLHSSIVVVDGVRSMHEVKEFKKKFPSFKIIAVHASPQTRFERLIKRDRSDDPKDWKAFVERDQRELDVGIGDVIATADYMLVNESTIEQFREKITRLFRQVLRNV